MSDIKVIPMDPVWERLIAEILRQHAEIIRINAMIVKVGANPVIMTTEIKETKP